VGGPLPPIKIAATSQQLLQSQAQGWRVVRQGVIKSVPGDQYGNPAIPIKPDAFEWLDVTLFGIGNTDNALQQLQQQLQQRGSDLYAYALFTRVDVDFLGVKAVRYRLVLLHGFVELLEWAVAIVAIAFAAVIFIQYVTTGSAPALKDLQALWGSAITSVGAAAGQVTGGITNTVLMWTAAAGLVTIALGRIAKEAGTKAPPGPKLVGSIGVRAGGITGRVGA
jgi:hypothetical protein